MNKNSALKRTTEFLLLLALLPLVCSETIGWNSEEELDYSQEEMADAIEQEIAEILAKDYDIYEIALKKNITPEQVMYGLLWYKDHPKTLMPSTPLDYTAQDITTAAAKYSKSRDRNLAALKELDREQIMRETGATLEDINKAVKYYRQRPCGPLPTTFQRIQELAQQYPIYLKQINEHRLKKKNELEKLDIDEIRAKTRAPLDQIKKAFTYYRSNPCGALPVTLERIQELAERHQNRLNRAKRDYAPEKAHEKYLKRKKKNMPQASKKQAPSKGKEKAVFEEKRAAAFKEIQELAQKYSNQLT